MAKSKTSILFLNAKFTLSNSCYFLLRSISNQVVAIVERVSLLLAFLELSGTEVSSSKVMVSASPLLSIILESSSVLGQSSLFKLEGVLSVFHRCETNTVCCLECLLCGEPRLEVQPVLGSLSIFFLNSNQINNCYKMEVTYFVIAMLVAYILGDWQVCIIC